MRIVNETRIKPYFETEHGVIYQGDALTILKQLPSESVQCVVTSPPYWRLRDYGVDRQIGLEKTPEEYVSKLVDIFRELKRVLKKNGTLWLNLGDSYASGKGTCYNPGGNTSSFNVHFDRGNKSTLAKSGLKPKDLVGIPWRVAFALQADGWYLRQDIIWHKPNPMPEPVKDRCTKAHEYVFLLSKSPRYYYDAEKISEPLNYPKDLDRKTPAVFGGKNKHLLTQKQSRLHSGNEYKRKVKIPSGWDTKPGAHNTIHRNGRSRPEYQEHEEIIRRNKRSVWTIASQPFPQAHFATFPEKLVKPCILAGSQEGDTILDPFFGSGTVGVVALKYNRKFIGIDLNLEYCKIAKERIEQELQQLKLFKNPRSEAPRE